VKDTIKKKKESDIEKIIQKFIHSTNAFDVSSAVKLFSTNALIDDVSVGDTFKNTAGVRNYLDRFFVGYHTETKLVSVEIISKNHAIAQVDFTGDFGHETGTLDFTTNTNGLLVKINADLD
jgi:hypothetical protein